MRRSKRIEATSSRAARIRARRGREPSGVTRKDDSSFRSLQGAPNMSWSTRTALLG
jgi:hypothetical protein